MKRKAVYIVVSTVFVILLSCGLTFGILHYIRNKNIQETGNLLGVKWYNETDTEFTINTADELYEFAKLSNFYTFEGQTIYLGADIVINEGNASDWRENAPSRRWTPISGFAGYFDGQGHSISGLYGKGYYTPMALFVKTEYSCVIQNLKLLNSYFETKGGNGSASFVSQGGAELYRLYSDAIINHKGIHCGGIVSIFDKQSKIEECCFDGTITTTDRYCGGIIGKIEDSRVSIKHNLFSGTIYQEFDFAGTKTGGICGSMERSATLVIDDSLSCGAIYSNNASYTGSMIGSFHAGTAVTVTNTYASMDTCDYVIGGTSGSNTQNGNAIQIYGEDLLGVKAYQWTELNYEKYWTIRADDTPMLQCFADEVPSLEGIEKEYDISWYDADANSYIITSREQLYGLTFLASTTDFSGKNIKLGADIVVNEGNANKWAKEPAKYKWYPIQNFMGTFDGQGHTISGIYLCNNSPDPNQKIFSGLFGLTGIGSTLKDFKLKNSYFERMVDTEEAEGFAFLGSIAGEIRGSLDSVYSDAILSTDGNQVGGLVGRLNYLDKTYEAKVTVNNCWFAGKILGTSSIQMGGIAGYAGKGSAIDTKGAIFDITNCLNTGYITNTREKLRDRVNSGQAIGGLLGFDNSAVNINFVDCLSAGLIDVKYNAYVGSVMGRIKKENSVVTFENTYVTDECYTTGAENPIDEVLGTVIGGAVKLPEELLTGMKAYQFSNLDFKTYWSVVESGTPELQTFTGKKLSTAGVKKMVDTSWYSPEKKTFIVDSLEDLYGLYEIATYASFEGQTVKLGADIVVNDGNAEDWSETAPTNKWYPIGSNRLAFAGRFDGQGHTISGVYLTNNRPDPNQKIFSGLFGMTGVGSVLKDFKLTNSYFERMVDTEEEEGYAFLGSIAGEIRGSLDSVYSNAILSTDGNQVGGLVGRLNYLDKTYKTKVTVNNCWFDGKILGTSSIQMGGIAGYAGKGSAIDTKRAVFDIKNCLNTGHITNTREKLRDRLNSGQAIGGLLGFDNSAVNINFVDCLSAGLIDVKYNAYVGSVMGRIKKENSVVTFENTYVTDECYTTGAENPIDEVLGTVIGGAIKLPGELLTGMKAYQFSNLDYEKYWTVVESGTPELQTFTGKKLDTEGVKKMADTSWYSSKKKTLIVDSLEDLYGLYEIATYASFEGQTVKLGADIVVNDGNAEDWSETAPTNKWYPIGSNRVVFEGTFDGQGHTISGIYLSNNRPDPNQKIFSGLFGMTGVGSTLKDFKLTNSYFERMVDTEAEEGYAFLGSIAGEIRGSLDSVYSNAILSTDGNQVGGLVGRLNYLDKTYQTKVTVNNCWFDGKILGTSSIQMGGLAGYAGKGSAIDTKGAVFDIKNCLNTGYITNTREKLRDRLNSGQAIGGLLGFDNSAVNINFVDCLSAGLIDVKYNAYVGSVMGRLKGTKSVVTFEDTYVTDECYTTGAANPIDEVLGTVIGEVIKLPEELLTGMKAYQFSSLDFKTYWTVVESGTPELQKFTGQTQSIAGVDKIFDTSWIEEASGVVNDEVNDPYILNDAADLYGFTYLSITNDFKGKTIVLGKDIVVNEGNSEDWGEKPPTYEWYPIGTAGKSFAGTFDGQNYSISGLWVNNLGTNGTGLFGAVDGGTVRNVSLLNSYIESDTLYTGSIVGFLSGNITNVYSNAYVTSSEEETGGIVGRFGGGGSVAYEEQVMSECWFNGKIQVATRYAGGLVGRIDRGHNGKSLNNCLNTGNVISTLVLTEGDTTVYVGGIAGAADNALYTGSIRNTMHDGTVSTASNEGVGAIIGFINLKDNDNRVFTFENVYTTEAIGADSNNRICGIGNWGSAQTINGEPMYVSKDDVKGVNAYINTALKFYDTNSTFNVWAVVDGDTPVIKSLYQGSVQTGLNEQRILTNWYYNSHSYVKSTTTNSTANYTIDKSEELCGLEKLVNDEKVTFAGMTVKLTDDITINEGKSSLDGWTQKDGTKLYEWTPIGYNASNRFKGEFDGDGHSISGIYFCDDEGYDTYYSGFFGITGEDSILRNFRIENSYFESKVGWNGDDSSVGSKYALMGSVAGQLAGDMHSVYSEAILISVNERVGGLVGCANPGSSTGVFYIDNCWFAGKVQVTRPKLEKQFIGGIVGDMIRGELHITNTLNSGTVTLICTEPSTKAIAWNVGGIVGGTQNSGATLVLEKCLNTGVVSVQDNNSSCWGTGSIIGRVNEGHTASFTDVYATTESFSKRAFDYAVKPSTTVAIVDRADILGDKAINGCPNLFSASPSAWVTDTVVDQPNRGTPILSTFAEWWKGVHEDE